jgi:hypothetical protein
VERIELVLGVVGNGGPLGPVGPAITSVRLVLFDQRTYDAFDAERAEVQLG